MAGSNRGSTPDGKHFVIFTRPGATAGDEAPRVTMLLNFFDELGRRASKK